MRKSEPRRLASERPKEGTRSSLITWPCPVRFFRRIAIDGTPVSEARFICGMVARGEMKPDEARMLISVSPIERSYLEAWGGFDTEEICQFRAATLAAFEKLLLHPEPLAPRRRIANRSRRRRTGRVPDDVRAGILAAIARGDRHGEIQKRFNVSFQTLLKLRRGELPKAMGRKPVMSQAQIERARVAVLDGNGNSKEIARRFGVTRLYRSIKGNGND